MEAKTMVADAIGAMSPPERELATRMFNHRAGNGHEPPVAALFRTVAVALVEVGLLDDEPGEVPAGPTEIMFAAGQLSPTQRRIVGGVLGEERDSYARRWVTYADLLNGLAALLAEWRDAERRLLGEWADPPVEGFAPGL